VIRNGVRPPPELGQLEPGTHRPPRRHPRRGQDEVEAVCHGDPIELKRSYKDRFLVAGPTPAGRILTVVLGPVPEAAAGVYYVFTARPAHRSERRYYHHQKGGSQP
jgi:hypothetical protein